MGADFLRHHHLHEDVAGAQLFEPSDPLPPDDSLPTASAPASQEFPLLANLLSTPQAIQELLHEFSDVVYSDKLPATQQCHNVRLPFGLRNAGEHLPENDGSDPR